MRKTKFLLSGLLAAASFSTMAGESYDPTLQQPASHLSRAQVRQSVLDAQRAGALSHNDVDLPDNGSMANAAREEGFAFGTTRTAAAADVEAAQAAGDLGHTDADVPGVAQGSQLTRRAVRAEAIAQRRLVTTEPGKNTIAY